MTETKDKEQDMINHPGHYTSHPSGVEAKDVIANMKSPFLGAAVKYWMRRGLKRPESEDLQKAAKYVEFEIARRENKKTPKQRKALFESVLKHERGKTLELLLSADSTNSNKPETIAELKKLHRILRSAAGRALKQEQKELNDPK